MYTAYTKSLANYIAIMFWMIFLVYQTDSSLQSFIHNYNIICMYTCYSIIKLYSVFTCKLRASNM